MRVILFSLLTLALLSPAQAEVYTYTDADGNQVFTDRPKAGNATRIELAHLMSRAPASCRWIQRPRLKCPSIKCCAS